MVGELRNKLSSKKTYDLRRLFELITKLWLISIRKMKKQQLLRKPKLKRKRRNVLKKKLWRLPSRSKLKKQPLQRPKQNKKLRRLPSRSIMKR